MSFADDIAAAILPLTGVDGFGRDLMIDGSVVAGIFFPDVGVVPGEFDGSIVERYRLQCAAADLSVVMGQTLEIDSGRWVVVWIFPELPSMTDIIVERFV